MATTKDTSPDAAITEDQDNGKVIPLIPTPGIYVHKFSAPFEYGGESYEDITFDFAKLKGTDMISIETEMQNNNEYALAPEISRAFQSKMAARAAKIGSDVIEAMPLIDFNKITNAARDFLLSTGY